MGDIRPVKLMDVEISVDKPASDIKKLVQRLRPQWKTEDVEIKFLSGGYLNMMYSAKLPSLPDKQGLIVRVYGDLTGIDIFNREREIAGLQLAYQAGCGTPMYALFKNGVVMGFAPGRMLKYEDFIEPDKYRLIAKALAQLHHMDPNTADIVTRSGEPFHLEKEVDIMSVYLRRALVNTPDELPDKERNEIFKRELHSKESLIKELDFITSWLESLGLPIVFCHNDIHINNAIYDPEEDRVYLYDLELCGFNYQYMDLINFYAGMPYWAQIGFLEQEKTDAPWEQVMPDFIRAYLETKFHLLGKPTSDITDADVQDILIQTEIGAIMMDFWLMAAGVTYAFTPAIRFDGLANARLGNKRYYPKKDKLFRLGKEYIGLKQTMMNVK